MKGEGGFPVQPLPVDRSGAGTTPLRSTPCRPGPRRAGTSCRFTHAYRPDSPCVTIGVTIRPGHIPHRSLTVAGEKRQHVPARREPGRHRVERRGEVPASERPSCSGWLGEHLLPVSAAVSRAGTPSTWPDGESRRQKPPPGAGRPGCAPVRPPLTGATPPVRRCSTTATAARCLQSVMSAAGTAASSDPPCDPSRFLAANSRMGRRRPSVVDRWPRIAALRHHQVIRPPSRSNPRSVVARVHSGMRRVPALTRVNPSAERGASAGAAHSGAGRLWARAQCDSYPGRESGMVAG